MVGDSEELASSEVVEAVIHSQVVGRAAELVHSQVVGGEAELFFLQGVDDAEELAFLQVVGWAGRRGWAFSSSALLLLEQSSLGAFRYRWGGVLLVACMLLVGC